MTPVLSAALLGLLHLPTQAHQAAAGASANKPAASAPASPAEQTAWGIAATPTQVQRTITIDMGDNMRFSPDLIEVKQGETLKLVVRNQGRKLHELVLGTAAELDKHAELMKRHPGMEHDEPGCRMCAPVSKATSSGRSTAPVNSPSPVWSAATTSAA